MGTGTRDRLLEATARLLEHRGFHGTSLSAILEESGAPRGSLYFHFPGGKDQLVYEATRLSVERTTRELRLTLEGARDPAAGVGTFVRAAAGLLRESAFKFGCPVSPVILDAVPESADLGRLCRDAFVEWIGLFRSSLIGAGVERRRAESLAVLIEAAIEGMLLIARAYHDTAPLDRVADELETAIEAALPGRDGRRLPGSRPRPAPVAPRRSRASRSVRPRVASR